MKMPILAIAGPTASGKSDIAIALSQRLDGEIISADSVQVFRGLDIGSAKPTKEEQALVPHHLIDVLDPWEQYTAALFAERVWEEIAAVRGRDHVPILCGGTGFYLRSVLYDLDFGSAPPDPVLRKELEALNCEELYSSLQKEDADSARIIHPNDKKRIIRALEIARSGGSKGTFRTQKPREDFLLFCPDWPRETLYSRINVRVDRMVQNGLIDEVRTLLSDERIHAELPAMQSIGYKQICAYLAGELPLEDALEDIKQQTRRFAKRQLTWFRHEEGVRWLDMTALQTPEHAAEESLRILEENTDAQ